MTDIIIPDSDDVKRSCDKFTTSNRVTCRVAVVWTLLAAVSSCWTDSAMPLRTMFWESGNQDQKLTSICNIILKESAGNTKKNMIAAAHRLRNKKRKAFRAQRKEISINIR